MKIDFSQKITIGAMPVVLEQGKDATLGDLCREALNAQPADRRLPIEELLDRGKLAQKLRDGAELDISPEEATLIRRCLPDRFQHAELVVTIHQALD